MLNKLLYNLFFLLFTVICLLSCTTFKQPYSFKAVENIVSEKEIEEIEVLSLNLPQVESDESLDDSFFLQYELPCPELNTPGVSDFIKPDKTNSIDNLLVDKNMHLPDLCIADSVHVVSQKEIETDKNFKALTKNVLESLGPSKEELKEKKIEKKEEKKDEIVKKKVSREVDIIKYPREKKEINKQIIAQNISPKEIREVFSRPGDDIEISLGNSGWIFTGYLKKDDAEGLPFISKESRFGETIFLFKAKDYGSYDLKFLLQNHYSGIEQREEVRVKVVDGSEFISSIEDVTDYNRMEEDVEVLYKSRNYKAALEAYLNMYKDSSPFLNDRIAELYLKTGNNNKAKEYLKKNMKGNDDFSSKAIIRMIGISLKEEDKDNLLAYLDLYDQINSRISVDEILEITKFLNKEKEYIKALQLLNNYLSQYQGSELKDELYLLLGMLYEKNTSYRDFKKAKDLYLKIEAEFPGSNYTRSASKRIEYLNRFFFFIQ